MQANAVAQARAITAQAFAAGTVPAPYYLYLLARAQRAAMPAPAVANGCAGPATAGGSVFVQRHTAGHKQVRKAPASHAATPTATRAAWVPRKVRQQRLVNGTPVMREFWVTTRAQVTVVA